MTSPNLDLGEAAVGVDREDYAYISSTDGQTSCISLSSKPSNVNSHRPPGHVNGRNLVEMFYISRTVHPAAAWLPQQTAPSPPAATNSLFRAQRSLRPINTPEFAVDIDFRALIPVRLQRGAPLGAFATACNWWPCASCTLM